MNFTLADGKRQGCRNLKLDEHGIELCLRQPRLTLETNKNKALFLRVIRAVNPADEQQQQSFDPHGMGSGLNCS